MKVTKEQKIYIGLLGLGLVAFVLDRTVFTPPAAQAADASELLVARSSAPVPHATSPALKTATVATSNPVAQKLAGLSESLHLSDAKTRDAFTPAAAWLGTPVTLVAETKIFEQKHHLDGVMVGRRPAAMIDGNLVAVGETVDGYKLVAVAQGAATLRQGQTSVTLKGR